MLFGKGVAASRNQYNVYVMELDQDMREISVDVRRFCYKKDYSFSVCPMPDGSVSLFSNGSGDEQQEGVPVMVPFEALQQADRNRNRASLTEFEKAQMAGTLPNQKRRAET